MVVVVAASRCPELLLAVADDVANDGPVYRDGEKVDPRLRDSASQLPLPQREVFLTTVSVFTILVGSPNFLIT